MENKLLELEVFTQLLFWAFNIAGIWNCQIN